jgi:ring-1,2-phenylacetyl-CoA epoxidase subunit PaaD
MVSKQTIIELLSSLPDPEIPVITIQDLGIIREVEVLPDKITISITPTYSGCPAMKQIENDILQKLKESGIENAHVKMIYHPAWTTDWMSDEAKEKLKTYGIAPPSKEVVCPRCQSLHTQLISQFGSTACKALYRCNDCKEAFDHFKCH